MTQFLALPLLSTSLFWCEAVDMCIITPAASSPVLARMCMAAAGPDQPYTIAQ